MRTVAAKSQYQTIALTSIHESATNPRRSFDDSKLTELADSLRTQGLIQPITVRPNNDGYEIIAEARRFRAAQLAAFEEIPVRVVQLSDAPALEWMLVELSTVSKSFLCRHAARYVVYVNDVPGRGSQPPKRTPDLDKSRMGYVAGTLRRGGLA